MNGDELILRIVPELDQNAKKQVEDDLNTISGNIPIGGKPSGGADSSASNALKKEIQTRIEVRELEVRKIQQSAQEEIKFLQQRAAQGKITTTQMASDIQLVENAQVQANDRAIASFNALQAEILKTTGLTEAQSTALQKKLLLATDRVNNNFVSMSRSMGTLTSDTKSANIAFANFGRIVQDAPFGLLGISNNIDPLLNSFSQLKQETDGTGAALSAMGKQLLGPAGLIFLLGSALPTALLFAQKYFQDTEKESNLAADAVKRVREEFSKLSAQAAGDKGLAQVNEELKANETALNAINGSIEKYQVNLQRILALQNQSLQQGGLSEEQQAELNRLRRQNVALNISQLATDKAIIEASTAELDVTKAQITAQNDITSARQRYGIAVALTAKEEEELSDKRKKEAEDARKEAERLASIEESRLQRRSALDQALSKLFDDELTQRIKAEQASVRELLKNTELTGKERTDLNEYYRNIESTLTKEHDARMLAEQQEANDRKLAEDKRAADEVERQRKADAAKELQDAREKQSILAMIEQDKIALMFARGQTIKAIEAEEAAEIARIKAEYGTAEATGLITNAERVAGEKDAIAEAELSAERAKMDALVQMGNMAANAIIGGLSAAFGQSKGIKAAEVAIQSITAAYEAFSSVSAKFAAFPGVGTALGAAAAAGILAQGRKSISEIYATKPGTTGAGSAPSASVSAPRLPFVNDLGVAGQVAGTITPFGASMSPSISITANLDRQGLALAVRDGESDIATRQIPFAS